MEQAKEQILSDNCDAPFMVHNNIEQMKNPVSIITNEDCMVMMGRYPDKFFELAIVDPPYGIGAANANFMSRGGIAAARDYKSKDWDKGTVNADYVSELFRVSKNQIMWGYNYYSHLLPTTASVIIWDKTCHDKYTCDYSDGEAAWCSIGGSLKIFRYLWKGMMQGSPKNGTAFIGDLSLKEERFHPTQKPIALYRWSLQNYAKQGDKILDTHLGSGSSRIAAYKLGFDFYACEIDKEYYEAQEARFKKAIAEPLFDQVKPIQGHWFD